MTSPAEHGIEVSDEKLAAVELLDAQLSLLWRRARAINHQLTRSVHPDLEPAAYGLLSVLHHQGGMRLTELAKRIGVGKPSVSRQIAFLVSIGLVAKESDPLDGRAQLIELTPAGLEKMRSVHAGRQRAFHEQLAGWDERELADLARLVAKLNAEYGR
ncbi:MULTISPECIES: MarR family winged helix-turn-helix transcriptional regulator [Arthrobacter]|uniref:MarR family transcriptional regulator n=1 Tax=Arthrobacter psychrochitiniphilus TaxID=291045 RepID=A0A2V3DUS7_9MICC|nr:MULTISPECIES: MarR family transcriptional regulator [Arthrobacter]NYG16858.1 DNA-binding MarR family transcriptional regulator [Arthrobacter psychrochitiniphilus]PXA69061.1 MarR family transcriptional regulator [Arthrobacter psychrochitiniphilus]